MDDDGRCVRPPRVQDVEGSPVRRRHCQSFNSVCRHAASRSRTLHWIVGGKRLFFVALPRRSLPIGSIATSPYRHIATSPHGPTLTTTPDSHARRGSPTI